nr:hypothetical protein Iba_chr11cCG12400 [Ipomoea batatas]
MKVRTWATILLTKKKAYMRYSFFQIVTFCKVIISTVIFLKRLAGPHDHLCCWYLYALKLLGNSLFTYYTPRKTNFQPLRPARQPRSMSSTVVRSFHPPASSNAPILQIPAVPAFQFSCISLINICPIFITTIQPANYRVDHSPKRYQKKRHLLAPLCVK